MDAFVGDIPVMDIPASGLYHRITALDLVLTHLLAGERIGRRQLAELGHGGLCLNWPQCSYPICLSGK